MRKSDLGGLIGFFIGLLLFISTIAVQVDLLIFRDFFGLLALANLFINSLIILIGFIFGLSLKDGLPFLVSFIILLYDTILGVYLGLFYEKSKDKGLFTFLTLGYFILGAVILYLTILFKYVPKT